MTDPHQSDLPLPLLCGSASNSDADRREAVGGGVPCLTSLDPVETTVDVDELENPHQARMHSPWRSERRRIIEMLQGSFSGELKKRASRLRACCQVPRVIAAGDGSVRVAGMRCRDRLCPRCASIRARVAADKVRTLIARMNSARMLTLTIRSSEEPLREQLAALHAAFRRLRASSSYKARVKWGVYTVELTFNAETRRWHPHIHLVFDGEYWAQARAQESWEAAVRDQAICDIRALHDRDRAAKYVAKYLVKPGDFAKFDAETFEEFAIALHGLRLLSVVGKQSAAKLGGDQEKDEPRTIRELCSVFALVRAIERSVPAVLAVVPLIRRSAPRLWPFIRGMFSSEQPPPGEPAADDGCRIAAALAVIDGPVIPAPVGSLVPRSPCSQLRFEDSNPARVSHAAACYSSVHDELRR